MRKLSTLITAVAPCLALLGLTLHGTALAGGTPAGTVITNQASAEALGPNGESISAVSDRVTTVVSPVCAVSITPDGTPGAPGQTRHVLPGEQALFSYSVLNVGNQTNTFALSSLLDASSAFAPGSVNIYLDDGSGQIAPGAQSVNSVTLDADKSARLLMTVQTAGSDRGGASVSLNASCGQDLGGASDTNNYAAVVVDQPPVLGFSKSFSPAHVKPGDASSVTLTVVNSGQGASREVIVTDPLNTLDLAGSSFVAGSAVASAGTVEYSADGSTFTASQTSPVAAIRLRLPSLAPGARATLTFKLLTSAAAENRTLRNLANVTSGGVSGQQAGAALDVRYTPAVALGPVGNPAAPEGSAQDSQTGNFAVVGQTLCFTQTLQNTGDVTDDFTVTPALQSGAADLSLLGVDGQPLSQPVRLAPGQSLNFQVCLKLTGSDPVKLVLKASGGRGTSNSTTDLITRVESRLPELNKTVDPSGQVQVGETLTYTLSVHNPYDRALANVMIRDPLASGLTFVSASDGGQLQGGAVVWTLSSLAPGETRRLTLRARVADTVKDGETLANTFDLSGDDFTTPLHSPTVKSAVWSAALAVGKTVSAPDATIGDRLNYTVRLRNLSQVGSLGGLTVTDTLPAGVAYLPGSGQMNGKPLADPQVSGRVLTWTLGALGPQTEAVLTYAVRVLPGATGELVNRVSATGQAVNGAVVASNEARAGLKLRPGFFTALSDIVGVVFVDRNRDGVYQTDLDTPIERARVVLADGRISLTDGQGRYHFAAVPEGFTALRLDPASVPYAPLSLPQDGGRPGSRGVFARGLTSVDFPLAGLMGEVGAFRETTLRDGPLTLHKQVSREGDGSYRVTLTLTAGPGSGPLHLEDPLPAGATLTQGQNVLDLPGVGPEGTTLTYHFRFDGAAERAVTDPTVTWRNP
ncbi:DUF11 domain-containing protein [Deinococcus metallilatus]|uniref:Repeat protein (TIGR01451 family) n=1 Tax=Deinococcus metallilatus TaxID=1211322 RepID=A0ABR6N097_9DEIO|nr:DUF11 domain-containing protein [Deinococcus metallilatus]MBB5297369.1 putative repeat protein (TIGR01451 family) [Deinococcus metallilatus]GMA17074.1 hypothetical protein GCM10025871_34050 [Deinococcus metallilatus]